MLKFREAIFQWGLHKESLQELALILFSTKKTLNERIEHKEREVTTLRQLMRIAVDAENIYPKMDPQDE